MAGLLPVGTPDHAPLSAERELGSPLSVQLRGRVFCAGETTQESVMIDAGSIREHMEVIGSDGGHVGKVDHVLGQEIELARMDLGSGFKHHMIPVSWVDRIENEKVCLTLTKDEAKSRWTERKAH
jgi:hypothetical protein